MAGVLSTVFALIAVACLNNHAASGFTPPAATVQLTVAQARATRCHANLLGPDNDADEPPMVVAAVDDEVVAGEESDGSSSDAGAAAKVVGISGIAGAGATVATTVVTTAGGVCAGGACVAGAGAVAAGAGTGGAAAAAATGGGLLAGAKALLFGGALAAGVAFNGLSAGDASAAPTLESMVRASTPLEVAVGNGRPTVLEFYGNSCPHCHEAARQLRAVEENAIQSGGINWVMIDTDDPRLVPLWMKYHVDEIPHFEFLDAEGYEVGYEVGYEGEVAAQRIEERIAQTAAHSHAPSTFGWELEPADQKY